MTHRNPAVILLLALIVTTVGMAFVTFGVVIPVLFFPGVYLLAIGLLGVAAGALLDLFATHPS